MKTLKVSPNGHHLVWEDGEPFFLLADTAWSVAYRATDEELEEYLKDRRAKGFTAIQFLAMPEIQANRDPNGQLPMVDNNPETPNEAYFAHLDSVLDRMDAYGFLPVVAATWGEWVSRGNGPHIFDPQNARIYGEWLGNRYQDRMILWVNGGDVSPIGYEETWRALGQGLKKGSRGRHLVTHHGADCIGDVQATRDRMLIRGSSPFFHSEDWLDVNMYYSGHFWYAPAYRGITRDYQKTPSKPTFDGEPNYENHPAIPDGATGYHSNRRLWDGVTRAHSHLVRTQAYWAMLAGACGHTYGCNEVWAWYDPAKAELQVIAEKYKTHLHWRRALQLPGAAQMGILRHLFESRPWQKLVPDQSMIREGQGKGIEHIRAARSEDGSFAFVYTPAGKPFTVNLEKLQAGMIKAYWYDPRAGTWSYVSNLADSEQTFSPPRSGTIWDWILVLDDAGKGYPTVDVEQK
ncbi:MAG: glycoside hydrolase family 140 protein [Kiritimatiellae bacterium]|nr:glycoside hydrolase family 140 protein [Kiritimatiellia bacterium]